MFVVRVFFMALRGLQTNLLRTLLATLGVIIGVSAVVSAMSILAGAERDINERFESMGADQVVVFPGTARRRSRESRFDTLKEEDADAIAEQCSLIKAVAPQVDQVGQVKYLHKNKRVQVLATTESYETINDYHAKEGNFLSREDIRAERKFCVLGSSVTEELFGPISAVGRRVKINGQGFTVKGVMEEKGVLGFRQVDDQVIVPLTTGMDRLFGLRFVTSITCQAIDSDKVDAAIQQVSRTLRGQHRIRAGDEDDFQVLTQQQAMERVADVTKIFKVVLYSIAGISLVVGGIGIMNIMLVSVTERTREIGVRMAVGATRPDIAWQFLIEAAVISMMGGALGIVVGLGFSDLLEQWTQVLETYTPNSAIVLSLVMAALVGILSGVYPAIRAAQLDPVEALRYE